METSLPSGSEWHADLLAQMSGEIDEIRPAVISHATRECLDVFRGFRHVVRNVYALNLRPARMKELLEGLPVCLSALHEELEAFAGYLDKLE